MFKLCLGGTFNPIHHGHLLCARAAAEAVGASGVVLIPTGQAPHKLGDSQIISAAHRLAMCQLAIVAASGFEIDDRETRRAGPSFTIETARELTRSGWGKVSWLIGADMLPALPAWRLFDELIREVNFVIMERPGSVIDWGKLPGELQSLRSNVVAAKPQIDISATDIRRRVQSGLPIDFLCPPAVGRYIRDHDLYRQA